MYVCIYKLDINNERLGNSKEFQIRNRRQLCFHQRITQFCPGT